MNGYAEGSALITAGRTRVLVTATVLPRATRDRKPRPQGRIRPDGRSLEIQRLIGRSLRQTTELGYLKGRAIHLDCDVLEADGGTRVASTNAGMVALVEALVWMKEKKIIPGVPLKALVAGVSVVWRAGAPVLDPDYEADSTAEVDMNAVFVESGELVEIQATGEKAPVPQERLVEMLALAREGAGQAFAAIRGALGEELLAEAGLTS